MKIFTFLISVFFILSNISAQQLDLIRNESGNPTGFHIYDTTTYQTIALVNLSPEEQVGFDIESIDINAVLNELKNQTTSSYPNYQPDYMIQQFETGSPIEGDLVSGVDLSSDGTKLFVSHRHSGNVFVYDADTYDTIAVIKAARGIIDTHLTDSCLYLCCRDTRQLFIIDVTDYSIKNSFEIDIDAIQVEVTFDEELVIVGFNSFINGWVTAYNVNTGEVVYQTDEPMIHVPGLICHIPGRTSLAYTSFEMSPKGNQFLARITDNNFNNYPGIFDAYTGELVKTFNPDRLNVSQYSPTGDTLYLLTNNQVSGRILRRIDCSDFSTIDSIVINESYSSDCRKMALYNNGSTVFIPMNSFTEYVYAVFDFTSNSYQNISAIHGSTMGESKIEQSPDKRFVFIQHSWTYQVFDLETNELRGDFPPHVTYGSRLCAAADGERLFMAKPGYESLYDTPQEGVLVMDYSDPDDVFQDTLLISAELPEADQASSAVISRDGEKLYVLNALSLSLSIIDIASQSVDTIVNFPLLYEKITPVPKSDLILLTGSGNKISNSILFNPVLCEVVAEIDAPRTYAVQASPNGDYLYTLDGTAYLRKIEVNGENSEVVDFRSVGLFEQCQSNTWKFFEIYEDQSSIFGISPDGAYLLFGIYWGAMDESWIEVVQTETFETVAQVPVEEACIFDYVFTNDSKRVCLLTKNVDKPIIYLDGENSFVENTIPHDQYMYSGQYNPSDSMFYLLNSRHDYWIVDPLTGEVEDVVNIDIDAYPMWQLVFDEDGNVLIRRNRDIFHAGNFYDLPAASRTMYFDLGHNTCVIPIPGPDLVCLFNPLHVGSPIGKDDTHQNIVDIYPNPAISQITIDAKESLFTKIEILDAQGKLVYSRDFNNFKTTIGTGKFKSGIYVMKVHLKNHAESRKLIIQ